MKKITTLIFAFFLTAGIAFGQNQAQTDQAGSDHTATITQTGANKAEINQQNSNNTSTVTQNGSDNYAGTKQTGTGGTAIIEQIGDGNQAQRIRNGLPPVNQGAPAITGIQDFGTDNYGRVRQIGDNNEVAVEFTSTSARNDIKIDQGEAGNESFSSFAQAQVKDDDNTVDMDQRGTSNFAEVFINRNLTGPNDNGTLNEVTTMQEGSDNRIDRVFIKGNNNDVDVSQNGSSNEASVNIGSGFSSLNGSTGNFNVVDINQSGVGNSASATIVGNNNSSTITQN